MSGEHSSHLQPGSTVSQILDRVPSALRLFQQYQAGTSGICVITREDTLEELCGRFGVPVRDTLAELRRLEKDAS